jgi:hypothetical protein
VKLEAPSHDDVHHCLDCGAAVDYNFCCVCGQETRLHVPSAFEFFHEFVAHYVALEGKLWRTLGLLLFRPGMLSAEYIAGRRARYVQPLRIYLSFSIIFFAVLKLSGTPVAVHEPDAKPAQIAAPASEKVTAKNPVETTLAAIDPDIGAKIDAFFADPERGTNTFFKYVPYAIFLLMPLFALFLKLLYIGSGRRYGEHMLFALHSNAFAYLMFSVAILIPEQLSFGLLNFALFVWLMAYLPTAMRRVYGGTRAVTIVRWLVLMALHTLCISLALLAVYGLAILG